MKKILAAAILAGAMPLGTMVANAADLVRQEPPVYEGARGGVRIGYLHCAIGGGIGYVLGSAKEVDCVFHPSSRSGRLDHYTGYLKKLGVDVGFTTRGSLVWAVFAPTAGYHHGSLAGVYRGVSAQATVGAGVGANVMVGGTEGSVHLQTISVQGQLGLNAAATGTSMTLHPAG
ncbi:MAG: DUF992 domain-containing protein [Rhizobiaceae bacterium]|nr:MAG: DUF992 domain-containing protein [Rhizobiaceae bacterium]